MSARRVAALAIQAALLVQLVHSSLLATSFRRPTARLATGGGRAPDSPAMCGLVAVFDRNLSPDEIKELTVKLTARLEHRGPDEIGYHGGEGFGLGHARLSIMDPSGGQQPLVSAGTGAVAVHNGEIYNHAALRDEVKRGREAAGSAAYDFATGSDTEVVLPLFEDHDAHGLVSRLDGMFAIVVASADGKDVVAARDPCGIKPLYRGWNREGGRVIFASELKCLVGQVDCAELVKPGHLWTPDGGYERYFSPEWFAPLLAPSAAEAARAAAVPSGSTAAVRDVLRDAVRKRLMSDVGYGLLLSGGLDSAIVATLMAELTDMSKIKSFTVGMANSPDVMAARAVAKHVGTDHYEHIFTADEAFAIVPRVVEHLETYEPELIRSAIPNYFLARLASQHTKVVLTGEGADELFAGYLYFRDCPDETALHLETLRIFDHLASVNLQRADRMCMAHGLEARVPFLDVSMLEQAFAVVSPSEKMHVFHSAPGAPADAAGDANGAGERMEKWALRNLFDGEIPSEVLWRTKAMQCEGVGTDWVSVLQAKCAAEVSDADFAAAAERYPRNTPQSKEEYFYRRLFEAKFGEGMDEFVHVWEGGCRAGGAAWQSRQYTRAGLADVDQLRHGLMDGADVATEASTGRKIKIKTTKTKGRSRSASMSAAGSAGSERAWREASDEELGRLERTLVSGGDTRLDIDAATRNNAYHCPALPLPDQIVRGSCTGSPPSDVGIAHALTAMRRLDALKADAAARADGGDGGAGAVYIDGFGEEVEQVRRRLAAALELPEGSALFLAASGTCAEYIPLAIAQQLYPGSTVRSVLAADGETGAGGVNACASRYFNKKVPLDPLGERAPDVPLEGFPPTELLRIAARTEDGAINDAEAAMAAASWEEAADGADPVWLIRQVLGCKTGFSTPRLSPPAGTEPARVLELVDLCQLRKPLSTVSEVLGDGALMLLTGSKFFQGSAFSAGVVVPAPLVKRLREGAADAPPLPAGLADFISRHEVPAELAHWREQLPATPNEGLLLRWHTALPLVEKTFGLEPQARAQLEERWVRRTAELLDGAPGLEVISAELGIVSFALRKRDGKLCSKDELRLVHRHLANDASHLLDLPGVQPCDMAAVRCFIGQPVGINSEYAVLRLAIGAELVGEMADGRWDEAVDASVVRKIAWVLASTPELQAAPAAADAKPAAAARKKELVMNAASGAASASSAPARAARARDDLKACDAVCFDVDSTVIIEEGIDQLAAHLGCGDAVAALTGAAMGGSKPFHEALAERLDVMRPTKAQLDGFVRATPAEEKLTPRVAELISRLISAGKHVYLVSGGFRQMIEPIAEVVGVRKEDIYANRLLFDDASGDFAGFDASEPTSRAGGKAKVVADLKAKNGYANVVMVGDGATDMEARDVPGGADAFIGFGGIQVREKVKAGADWFVHDFGELIEALE